MCGKSATALRQSAALCISKPSIPEASVRALLSAPRSRLEIVSLSQIRVGMHRDCSGSIFGEMVAACASKDGSTSPGAGASRPVPLKDVSQNGSCSQSASPGADSGFTARCQAWAVASCGVLS
jgi:hypothetical protein